MATGVDHWDTPAGDGEMTDRGYEAWKRDKIERGLAQSRDRSSMIPIEQMWRDQSLER